MKFCRRLIISLFLVTVFGTQQFAWACDAFSVVRPEGLLHSREVVVAKNFDWGYGHGLIMVNKSGLQKKALSSGTPAQWTSKFGSITFNQVARELPQGGVNEAGLVVEVLWLDSAQYPAPDTRPAVSELQWVQYQLDNFGSTQEVLDHLLLQDLTIAKAVATVHYLVCDKEGQCAAVDPIKGLIVTHSKSTLPFPMLTNSTYEDSVASANKYVQSDTCSEVPNNYLSLNRFDHVACDLANYSRGSDQESPVDKAFSILDSIAGFPGEAEAGTTDLTQWSIAYDLTQMKIHFKTRDSKILKTIDIRAFDYSCSKPVQVLDVNFVAAPNSDVTSQFSTYTDAADLQIADKSLLTGFVHLPTQVIDNIVAYPNTFTCQKSL
jgi:penicillin V acylase-like amidase (Ntn superfamily)